MHTMIKMEAAKPTTQWAKVAFGCLLYHLQSMNVVPAFSLQIRHTSPCVKMCVCRRFCVYSHCLYIRPEVCRFFCTWCEQVLFCLNLLGMMTQRYWLYPPICLCMHVQYACINIHHFFQELCVLNLQTLCKKKKKSVMQMLSQTVTTCLPTLH